MPDFSLGPVTGGSRDLGAYLAVPDGPGPWPGVVQLHEATGLDDIAHRLADRLAAAGYLTLAPDLFSDGAARRCLLSTFRALFARKGKPYADIEAARQFLLADERCTGSVGVIGFCMGGGFALVASTSGFDAASVNYGMVPKNVEQVLAGACPIVGSYGGKDVSLRGATAKLETALSDLGVPHDLLEYPTAGHSFLNDRPFGPAITHPLQRIAHLGPDPEAAPDAWRRIESFFGEHLR